MAAANRGLPTEGHIVLRVGISLGDVMVAGGDLYGDVVNVAARPEGIAEPGGILVSGSASITSGKSDCELRGSRLLHPKPQAFNSLAWWARCSPMKLAMK